MDDWTFEPWPIEHGFIRTNWNADGKVTGGAWMGAAYTHCVKAVRATYPHVSLFGIGYTEDEARRDAEAQIRER